MREGKLQPPEGASIRLPPRDDDFLLHSTSAEELCPTPPYRRDPSTSNVNLQHYPASPAYESRVELSEMQDRKNTYDSTDEKAKPAVHYPADVNPSSPFHLRNDSGDRIHSRASSIAATDDEDDDDSDYDWSGEEDLVDEEAKFEERMGVKKKKAGWSFKRIITLLFSSLLGSTLLAGILITPALLIHFYWYKPHPTEHRLYVKENVQSWLFWAASNLLISWYLAMIVDLIPVLGVFFLSLAWGHVSEAVKSRVELYDSVKNTFKPVLYAASGWVSWIIIFENIYDLYDSHEPSKSRAGYTQRLSQVVAFLFFLTLVICLQRMLSHFIAFSFHATAFKERIADVQNTLSVLERLRDYKPKTTRPGSRTPMFSGFISPFAEKEGFNFATTSAKGKAAYDENDDADNEGTGSSFFKDKKGKGKKTRSRPGSQVLDSAVSPSSEDRPPFSENYRPGTPSTESPHRYPPSRAGTPDHEAEATLVQAAKVLKSAVLHDARNIKGKNDGTATMAWNVTNAGEAKRLAKSFYMRFRDRRRKYLIPADFYPAYGDDKPAAEAAFRVFDKNNNGDISRAEIKTTIMKVYKERRFLARSMRDVSVALRSLDQILLFFALIILFFISLSVFGVQVGDSLTSVYSLGIAASFIFKNTASNAFDAIMFLFVTHPYDTGDRCFIDNENLVVKKMTLFATIFQRADGTETYYFNSQLFSKFITNVRRSGNTFESLYMQMAWNTPTEKIDQLQQYLNTWLATEENRWFEPNTTIMFQNFTFQRYLEVTIGMPHNSNFQDWGARNTRKTAFHAAAAHYSRLLGITFYESPRPIYYVDGDTTLHDSMFVPSPPVSPQPPSPQAGRQFQATDPQDAALDARTDTGGPGPGIGLGFSAGGDVKATAPKVLLGFKDPEGDSLLRARKSKSRKAVLRGMGADG